jgi:tetratricopeptide (TPR) repeat protein
MKKKLVLYFGLILAVILFITNIGYAKNNSDTTKLITLATSMAEKMKDAHKKYVALMAIVQTHQDQQQKGKAEEILLQAYETAKIIEDAATKTEALDKIALFYNKIGDRTKATEVLTIAVDEAQNIEGESAEEVFQYRMLRKLAVDFVELGDFDQAIATAKEANTSAEYAFSQIADKYLENNDIPQALQVIDLIEDPGSKEWSLVKTAIKYAEALNFEAALPIISQIETNEIKASGLAQLATKYPKSNAHDQEQVMHLLADAVATARKITNEYGRDVLLAEVAGRYAEMGAYEQAKSLVIGLTNSISRANGLLNIARVYGRTGQPETAVEFMDEALTNTYQSESGPDQDDMIQIIVKAYGEIGRLDKAMALTKSISFDQSQADALISIARIYTKNKQYEDAVNAIQSIVAPAYFKLDAIDEIVDQLITVKVARAAKILTQSHLIVETVKDNNYAELRERVNTDIAIKYVEFKKYDLAIARANSMKNNDDDLIGATVEMLLVFEKVNKDLDKKGEQFLSDIGDLTWKLFKKETTP